MLRYAILACLCLLARADEDDTLPFPYRILHHETPGTQLRKYLISPDTFKGRDSYVVAQYNSLEHFEKRGISTPLLQIKLTLLNDRRDTYPKQCSLILNAMPHARELHVTSVRRINETNVVLSWTYLGVNDVANTTVVTAYNIVNNTECQETSLALNDILSNPVIVPTTLNNFIIFMKDANYCRQIHSSQCWWSYDLNKNVRQVHQFKPTFDWSTLRAERLSNGYIKIHGFNIAGDRYNIFLLNPDHKSSDNMYRVLEIPYNNKKLDIVSADMSTCWINLDYKSRVYCDQMDNHGKTIFRKKIYFKEPRTLIDVRTSKEGEIVLLTKSADCEGADCWNMYATIVTERSDVKHTLLPFKCSGDDQKQLTVFGAKYIQAYDRTDFYYGCKWENKFNFNGFFIY